jgi:hypothetical protein
MGKQRPILEKRVVTLIENVQFDTPELTQRAADILGYHIDEPVKSEDLPKTWKRLLEVMDEKHIQPFTDSSVQTYMDYVVHKITIWRILDNISLATFTLSLLAGIIFVWFWINILFVVIPLGLVSLGVGCITDNKFQKYNKASRKPATWKWKKLDGYTGKIPPVALQKALDIKENCGRIKLWVVEREDQKEAFLAASTPAKKRTVFVDGWDQEKQLDYRWI